MQSPLLRTGLLPALLLLIAGAESAPVAAEDIVQTTVCEVTADPAKFNHKLIELTGTATEDMEKFSLWDGECHHDKNNYTGIWLEYGGRKRSGAKYCCNQPLDRERTVSLVVEGFATATIDDKAFRAFDARVYPRGSTRARLIGRFFAGTRQESPIGAYLWGGYGHFGMYTLLVIQQVVSTGPEHAVRTRKLPAQISEAIDPVQVGRQCSSRSSKMPKQHR